MFIKSIELFISSFVLSSNFQVLPLTLVRTQPYISSVVPGTMLLALVLSILQHPPTNLSIVLRWLSWFPRSFVVLGILPSWWLCVLWRSCICWSPAARIPRCSQPRSPVGSSDSEAPHTETECRPTHHHRPCIASYLHVWSFGIWSKWWRK